MRLSDALVGYWLDKSLTFSATTTPRYQLSLQRFQEYIGADRDVATLTADDARRFLAHVRATYRLSRRTQADHWVHLSSFAAWLEREGLLPHFLRGRVPQPKAEKRVVEPFTPDEVKRLLTACERTADGAARHTALRDAAIVLVLMDSGLRVSELCALCLGDYDMGRGRLHVRAGKGAKARFVVVGRRSQKAVWKYLSTRPGAKETEPLFVTGRGTPIDRHQLATLLRRVGGRAGVAHVHPHRFRHAFAISLLRAGASAILLQELLGHESLQMVRRYVRLAEADIEAAVRYSPADRL